jgi:hypothetical protein
MGKISAACVYEDSNDALQALSATYECPSSVEPREGFLKKDEFLIILAGLQRQLGLDDNRSKRGSQIAMKQISRKQDPPVGK